MTSLELALEQFRLPELWRRLGLAGEPTRSCRSPFREDRHPSFSVFDGGLRWKDHGTGEGGDTVDFIAKAKGCTKSEAARVLIAMAGAESRVGHVPSHRAEIILPRRKEPSVRPHPAPNLVPMPADVQAVWDEGVHYLAQRPGILERIDSWRGWPSGTTRTLNEHGLIGCPIYRRARTTAFSVVAPQPDDFGISIIEIGFHCRLKPRDGERPRWAYLPGGTPALPFMLGAGFLSTAKIIAVFEGQWDAIAGAASAGWLGHDAAWPESVTVVGLRGAAAWRPFTESWLPSVPKSARFVLIQDADPAGDKWREAIVPALTRIGFRVRLLRPRMGKDYTEMTRQSPLNLEGVL